MPLKTRVSRPLGQECCERHREKSLSRIVGRKFKLIVGTLFSSSFPR
jgi:hypothetical protein